jgi:cytochrome P450
LLGYPFGLKFIPNGLFADLDNNHWKHRRSMFNPSFHKQVLYGLMDEFNLKGDMLLEKIEKKADGKTIISMLDEFNRATLDVIATVSFS